MSIVVPNINNINEVNKFFKDLLDTWDKEGYVPNEHKNDKDDKYICHICVVNMIMQKYTPLFKAGKFDNKEFDQLVVRYWLKIANKVKIV